MTSRLVLRALRRPLQHHHVASRRALSAKATKHEPIVLRPYQENCIEACLDALDSGCTRIGVSLPTGAGKTTVFLSLLERMKSRGTKAMVIVNSVELAKQAAAQAERLFPEMTVEIEQGQKHVATANADLTIATYQTLMRGTRIHKFDPAEMKAVIVDEAHHAAAPSYQRVLGHFDPNMKLDIETRPPSPVPIIGFSATFSRHDGLALGKVFDRIVYHRDFLEMIKEQWLCTVRFTTVKVKLDLSNVTLSGVSGDFNPTSLAHVVNTETINHLVLQAWIDRASARKSTLIFCVNLAHVRDLTEVFRQAGIDARYLHSGTPPKERMDLLTAFRAGEFPVLVNCSILTEGADIPNIDCVILARPTRSRNLFAQMIGRGMRLSPQTGKEDCHILDFVDSTTRVNGVMTTPSLFGLTPEEDVEDVPLEELEKRAEETLARAESSSPDVDIPDPKSVTYRDYENPFVLAKDTSGAPHISELSSFAWCGVGDDIYVLECLSKGFIRIQPFVDESDSDDDGLDEKPAYVAVYVATNTYFGSNAPYVKPRRILTAANLADAVRGADHYAKDRVCPGRMSSGLFRSAKWRKEPASDGQKEFIAKRWGLRSTKAAMVTTAEHEQKQQQVSKMTKGDAGNIISRLKHGAAVRPPFVGL
ncbi:P-loop containing nucleoside triphosphate hydrolase protein [Exidia glandulosa HHB12029]|uniref:p-loop containing nucleoside triphosphate hydrolase protein n=1 Tax=Exidia glandulosa HHB12029 TaxID=1314781 RepID=A0A165PU51_EXIGL|nr:P-loop containing nucleoside triphosphate hydrolase protein [Exidia glandulosa HHB12029]